MYETKTGKRIYHQRLRLKLLIAKLQVQDSFVFPALVNKQKMGQTRKKQQKNMHVYHHMP